MEHVGDAVAGRYLLVAPMCPRAARRQYHAVDLTLDRTVAVRFEPRATHDGRPSVAHHTPDGMWVLDAGTFEGSAFVVLEGPSTTSLAALEALAAAPCVPEPHPPLQPVPVRSLSRLRRTLVGAVAVGAVASVLSLLAVTRSTPPPASPPAAAPHGPTVWVSTAR